jgi:hypothetical protein
MRQAQQALYEMSDSLTGIEDLVTRLIHATRDPDYTPSRRDRERRTGKAYKLHPDGIYGAREKIRETCENFYIVQKQRAAQLRTYDKLDARIRKTQARPKGPITTGGKDGPNKIIRALLSPEMIRKVRSFADSVGIGAGSTQAQRDAMMEDAQFASLRNIAEANAKAQKQRHSFGLTDAYGNVITVPDSDDDAENMYTEEATGGQGGQGGGAGASGGAWKPPMLYTEEPAAAPYNNGAAPFQQQYPPQFQQQQFPQQQFPPQQFPQQQFPQQQQFPPQQFQYPPPQQFQYPPQQQFQQLPQQQFQQLPQQQFQHLPYANQGPGYYDQGQYNGGQGPLTFTQKFTKLIDDVMDSQIGQFVAAALATLVVYLIVCAFLRWLDNGTWIFCRLYDFIVGSIFKQQWATQNVSKAQIAAIAESAFKTSGVYTSIISDDKKAEAILKLTNAIKAESGIGKTIQEHINKLQTDKSSILNIPIGEEFFKEFFPDGFTFSEAGEGWQSPYFAINNAIKKETLAKSVNEVDALRFLLPDTMTFIAADTTAMALLYTSLVTSTFFSFVGARKRFFLIPGAAGAALVATWLQGPAANDAGNPSGSTPDSSWYTTATSNYKTLGAEEKMLLFSVVSAVLSLIGTVVAGGSAKDAASKATFDLTHDLKGEINLRREDRRLHDRAMAGVYTHPFATLLKAGTEAAGFKPWY